MINENKQEPEIWPFESWDLSVSVHLSVLLVCLICLSLPHLTVSVSLPVCLTHLSVSVSPVCHGLTLCLCRHQAGVLFDVDGVLLRGGAVIPAARRAFRKLLDQNNNFLFPVVFVTNAGSCQRHHKAQQLSHLLEVQVGLTGGEQTGFCLFNCSLLMESIIYCWLFLFIIVGLNLLNQIKFLFPLVSNFFIQLFVKKKVGIFTKWKLLLYQIKFFC